MRTLLKIAAVIVGLVVLGILVAFFILRPGKTARQTPPQETTSLPEAAQVPQTTDGYSTGDSQTLFLASTIDGVTVSAHDFTQDPATTEDPAHPGFYTLAGAASTSPFTIQYSSANGVFTLLLREEPLGEIRDQASDAFLQILGVPSSDACILPVVVTVASGTNAFYEGKNLDLSFCRGALTLPR